MKSAYYDLIRLLRCFVHGTKPDRIENIDWEKLIQLAQIHSVQGILGYLANQYKFPVEGKYRRQLESSFASTVTMSVNKEFGMESLKYELTEAGIDHLVFKGYVLRRLYPVPELRSFGDIDFLIRPEDLEKGHELMMTLGYDAKVDWGEVYEYHKGAEYYEMHSTVMMADIRVQSQTKEYFRNAWDHAVRVGNRLYEFTPEYHFLYLVSHIGKHVCGHGAGIRMYLDIAFFIMKYGDKLDWDYIVAEIRKLNLEQFLHTVLYAVQKWFDVESPLEIEPMAEEVFDTFTNHTLSAGTFGLYQRDHTSMVIRKQMGVGKAFPKFQLFKNRLFPSASVLESRYTFLQNKHWLLPVAWIVRLFVARKRMKRNITELGQIAACDTEQSAEINEILKSIGL